MKNKSLLIVISVFLVNYSYANNIDILNLIEKVSKQRMLCEQLTKDYLMIGSKINIDEAKIEFDESKSEFSENLFFIANNLKTDNAKNALSNVASLWSDFQVKINVAPSKSTAVEVIQKCNVLEAACKELADKVFRENNFKNSNIFNVFNKQKLNSQKIAKLWLANNWKIDYPNIDFELKEVLTSYEFSLSILMAATDKTSAIYKTLNKQNIDWHNFKNSFDIEDTLVQPQTVLDNTGSILKELNKTNAFYQKIAQQNTIVGL